MLTKYTPEQHIAAFWTKVDKAGPIPTHAPELGNCWLWTTYIDKGGYGHYGPRLAHRVAFGTIPDGCVIDHLCRVRACVRPSHLEAVTQLTNIRRGVGHGKETHCPKGHPYDQANTRRHKNGGRCCKTCDKAAHLIWLQRKHLHG